MWPPKDKRDRAADRGHCGYEFWSRRPKSGSSGKWAKLFCHRIERRRNDQLARQEWAAWDEMAIDPFFDVREEAA